MPLKSNLYSQLTTRTAGRREKAALENYGLWLVELAVAGTVKKRVHCNAWECNGGCGPSGFMKSRGERPVVEVS
jgi:hypothetical protein